VTHEPAPNPEGPDPELVFRSVRHLVLCEQERSLARMRADLESQRAVGGRVDRALQEIWEHSGLDLTASAALREAEQANMTLYVDDVRRRYGARDPERGPRLRDEVERALGQIRSGASQPYLIGADVVAANREQLVGYDGEAGNPATWLYDADDARKIKGSTTGGPGCVGGWTYCPAYTTWYFAWPATALGKHTVQAWLGYHGFFVTYAVPIFPDFCAYAGAVLSAKVQVYQQVGYPPKYSSFLGEQESTFFEKTGAGFMSSGGLDGSQYLETTVTITSLSQVYIAVTVVLDTAAKGPVAHAEINLADGANCISPPFVVVSS